jgi:hypothetical protein
VLCGLGGSGMCVLVLGYGVSARQPTASCRVVVCGKKG